VPQNDGVFRPVKVIAPRDDLQPDFPRACFSRFCQTQRVVDNVILALADALPDRVTAGNSAGIHFCAYAGFDDSIGEYWLYLEVNEGSYGGRHGKDAMDSVDNLMANTRNNPIEELDSASRCAATSTSCAGAGGARQVARRHRDHPPQPVPGRRNVLVRG
jgi:N-methylhydantoinase B/oxoprolinase/acetone carboxylase alpha subunit